MNDDLCILCEEDAPVFSTITLVVLMILSMAMLAYGIFFPS